MHAGYEVNITSLLQQQNETIFDKSIRDDSACGTVGKRQRRAIAKLSAGPGFTFKKSKFCQKPATGTEGHVFKNCI